MRALWLLLVVPATVFADSGTRLCPEGYYYAGEDTPASALNSSEAEPRDVWYEEVDRSEVYSCYKHVDEKISWLEANHRCWDEDAQLVSTEDRFEMQRIWQILFKDASHDSKDKAGIFTSGLFMNDIKQWTWLGSEDAFRDDLEVADDLHGESGAGVAANYRDCLTLVSDARGFTLAAFPCNVHSGFICEARVQTVTYYAWFMANWIDFLLGFLLVILFIALFISLCSFSASKPSGHTGRMHLNQRRARTTDPNSEFTVSELPPSYETSVRIHHPVDKDQLPEKRDTTPAGVSRMSQFQNRGRELMGKLYVYRK